MTSPSQTEYLSLSYRPDLGTISARWLRSATSPELRAGYAAMLRYALASAGCRHWLIDSRRREEIDVRDVHWLTTTFYPTLSQHLAGRVYLAFLAAPNQLSQVQDPTLPDMPYTHGDYCSINQFADEGEAVHWLLAQGAHPLTPSGNEKDTASTVG